jgi:biotin carboxyl carrier protein
MKYEAEIDGRKLTVDMETRDGRASAEVEGRRYQLEVAMAENGLYLFFHGSKVYEAQVWQEGPSLRVKLRDKIFGATLIDRKARRTSADAGEEGAQQLAAPMPGKVIKVLRGVGEDVGPGDGVIIVEAMKMENEITARKAGRVVEIRATEGATVNAGQVLAVIE